ncbi:CpaD family pilus assembly protein [Chelativorans salis]|uniref:CpaD family pilus assembly protein n=1 Tax=Chelativorans salis TaxID=2978478 RepID=A0ABT2LSN8_9HYPH|nr:CpaD family pilus assembly protein [Chelativorans sp. EGI FJ00035]MCT7376189.1 CpaD family pilus assembly protein [Chelativorans sp. EGI FJ00035]
MFDLRVKRGLLPLVAIAVAGVLSGCTNRDSVVVGAVPDDYRTRHPIVIEEKNEVLDLPVGASSHRMTWHQKAALGGFLDRYEDSGGAVVTMQIPEGAANSAAAHSVSNDFAALLHRYGVPKGYVHILAYQARPEDTPPIRLSYPVVKAAVGPCGRWPEDLMDTTENRNYANFGCSYQNNLAAQVANPADILGPRKMTPIDAENRDSAIGDYKAREVDDDFRARSEVDY